ncbi:hypothetical protein BCR44DRAFT_1035262 [Catenaria anguillulae PL171]|uniref:Uncharacterized protein n=1 Tax=Catenaria anguillulae PL171 TaxID=765915 RepID=A0A1Y2HSH2_9FUNG|nr:hypothetical protein BCR44DRAFT_1035262 [Catenaria anguillulae PL171]
MTRNQVRTSEFKNVGANPGSSRTVQNHCPSSHSLTKYNLAGTMTRTPPTCPASSSTHPGHTVPATTHGASSTSCWCWPIPNPTSSSSSSCCKYTTHPFSGTSPGQSHYTASAIAHRRTWANTPTMRSTNTCSSAKARLLSLGTACGASHASGNGRGMSCGSNPARSSSCEHASVKR